MFTEPRSPRGLREQNPLSHRGKVMNWGFMTRGSFFSLVLAFGSSSLRALCTGPVDRKPTGDVCGGHLARSSPWVLLYVLPLTHQGLRV